MRKCVVAAIVQVLLLVPAVCGAEVATYNFRGFARVSPPPTFVAPFTTFSGTFTFDTAGAPAIDPLDPTYAIYSSLQGLEVSFSQPGVTGASSFAMDSNLTINLWDDDPFFRDTFDVAGSMGGEFHMNVTLTDPASAAFATNASLPAALELAQFPVTEFLFAYQPASGLPAPDIRTYGVVTELWREAPPESVFKQAVAAAEGLDEGEFARETLKRPFVKKLRVALAMVEAGSERGALRKYRRDILPKLDGCALRGAPDRNDWLAGCDAQAAVYPLVLAAVDELEAAN